LRSKSSTCKATDFPIQFPTNEPESFWVHPGRLTWNLRTHLWKRKIIFQTIMFRRSGSMLIFGGVSLLETKEEENTSRTEKVRFEKDQPKEGNKTQMSLP